MEALDKKLQEVLSQKFEGAEFDVDPGVWEGINAELQPAAGVSGTGLSASSNGIAGSWITWVAASVLAISVAAILYVQFQKPSKQANTVQAEVQEIAIPTKPETKKAAPVLENKVTLENSEVDQAITIPKVVKETAPEENNLPEETTELPELVSASSENLPEPSDISEQSIPPNPEVNNSQVNETPNETMHDPAVTEAVPVQEEVYVEELQFVEENLITRPLPNVFSPNGDGINDVYLPEINDNAKGTFRIINMASGSVVYTSSNLQDGWNGEDESGRPMEPGAYLFVVELQTAGGVVDEATQLVRLFK